MPRVKIEEIVDSLSSEITKALEDAVHKCCQRRILIEAPYFELLNVLLRAIFSTSERVPDQYVEVDD